MNPTWRALVSNYKFHANKRNIVWDLSFEEAINLFRDNCVYCGTEPSQKFNPYINRKDIRPETIVKRWVTYNGIDRIDNDRGYYSLNCVSCCGRCNRAKGQSTIEEFENWIRNLVDHYIENNNIENNKDW